MTTKEIAEAVGKPERTVQNWTKKLSAKMEQVSAKMEQARKTSKPADYDLEETCAIIERGMGKNAASLFRENAKRSTNIPAIVGYDIDSAFKLAIISLTSMTQRLDDRVSKIEARVEQRQALLPAPEVKPRDNVSRIVRKYAHDNGIEYGPAWGELYREYGYRTNSNPSISARNRGMAIIDYIEAEGMVGTLEAIAIDWAK